MLLHLLNLLTQSFVAIPMALGSTWLGLLFPLVIAAVGEVIGIALFGLQSMRQNWKKFTGVGFAALWVGYTSLFLWCLVANVYSDHMNLTSKARSLRQSLAESENGVNAKLQALAVSKDADIEKLKISCAYKEGASGILQQQLTNQQNQLNTCLLQQREVPIIKAFPVFHISSEHNDAPRVEYVLITNIQRSPVDLIAKCDAPIADGSLYPLTATGGSVSSLGKKRLSAEKLQFSLRSPAWSPSAPVWITMFFVSPINREPHCEFAVE